jgi:hypothetical protein
VRRPGFWDDAAVDVRRVQPYQATKQYRCPGCDHEIGVGVGHVVAVPREAPDLRRHWHHACWRMRERRRPR